MRTININSRVSFTSREHSGKGTITNIARKATGEWFTVRTKDHPKGSVTVRRSQLS